MKEPEHRATVTVKGLHLHPEAPALDFQLSCGEALSFIGDNGTGKSRLLAALIGQADCGGMLSINGFDVNHPYSRKHALEKVGILFQESGLLRDLNIESNVSLPAKVRGWPVGKSAAKETDILLALTGCSDARHSYASQISEGESRRVAIARCLSGGSEILFLDEPVASLSTDHREVVLELLVTLRQEKVVSSIIIFTDDETIATRLTDTRITLSRNGPVFGIPSARTDINKETLSPNEPTQSNHPKTSKILRQTV